MAAEHRGLTVSRRRFVLGAGVAGLGLLTRCVQLPAPAVGSAQAPRARAHSLGFLGRGELPEQLRQGLLELGYKEGQNIIIEYRDAGDRSDRVLEMARELVVLGVDLIVAPGSIHVDAAKRATNTTPIVSLGRGADLVSARLVDSLARPGGNVTGLTSASDRLVGKRLQLLAEIAAPVVRVAVLWEANVGAFPWFRVEEPARALGIQILPLEVSTVADLEAAYETAVRERADALYVITTLLTSTHRPRLVALATEHRLPAMYDVDGYVRSGGLASYEGSGRQNEYRAAYFVDQILRGAKPADLPVEQPREFDFVINLQTAQALGLTIPPHVLLQATEVIR